MNAKNGFAGAFEGTRQSGRPAFLSFGSLAVFLLTLFLPLTMPLSLCEARSIQEPVVAGTFYPADPVELSTAIRSYLEAAGKPRIGGEVLGLIAPHAGYIYSGPAAGHAYAAVRGLEYDTVVVIAPSHMRTMPGVSVLDMDGYRTPLGEVPIDRLTIRTLMDKADWIRHIPALFSREHSLEVHLPFLQGSLKPGFSVIPVVMGSPDPQLAAALADILADALRGRNALFVASSDMSHYLGYDEARKMDLRTLELIENGDLKSLLTRCFAQRSQMCGLGPVQVIMRLAHKAGIAGGSVLTYQNSGDTAGERDRVVGYGSVAFINSEKTLSLSDKQALLTLARATLEIFVRDKTMPDMMPGSPALTGQGSAFVTLKTGSGLRGCVGQLQARGPLYRSVIEMTAAACSRDNRFPPVRPEELDDIRIEISVMSPLVKVKDVHEIRVGRDGLHLTASGRSGVLLPQVPVEQGWDREAYLKGLCRKAGLPDRVWEKPGARLYRFTAEVFRE